MLATVLMTIAELLADIAERRKISDRQLAAYMGVSTTAINRWKHGQGIPDPPYCWKIAAIAGMPVEDVMRMAGHLPESEESASYALPDEVAAIANELRGDRDRYGLWLDLGETLVRRHRGEEE